MAHRDSGVSSSTFWTNIIARVYPQCCFYPQLLHFSLRGQIITQQQFLLPGSAGKKTVANHQSPRYKGENHLHLFPEKYDIELLSPGYEEEEEVAPIFHECAHLVQIIY